MNPGKLKAIEELLEHLTCSQGKDLKSSLDNSKKPLMPEGLDIPGKESESEELGEDGKPKILEIEKISMDKKPFEEKADEALDGMEKKPGDEEEMDDDELKELLNQYLSD